MSAIPCASVSMRTMADGTLRLLIDIEPMHAQDAFKLFAAPGTPAAIAALQVGYAQADAPKPESPPQPEKPKGGPLAKLAGMWSADPEFWAWASNEHLGVRWNIKDSIGAATFIREICDVSSRAELDHNPEAEEIFHNYIRANFSKYLIARGILR
jgi:hypothetical protein